MYETATKQTSIDDFGTGSIGKQRYWIAELAAAKKHLDKWHKRGRKVLKKYLDDRDDSDRKAQWFNLFHSNTNIIVSSLYSRIPKPEVDRRFKDYQDDVGRVAALIVERGLHNELESIKDFDEAARNLILDRVLVGLGTAWVRYECETMEISEPQLTDTLDANDIPPGEPETIITGESTPIDYVYWQDFLWSPARTWDEVRWVARRVYQTQEQLNARFGEEVGETVPMNMTSEDKEGARDGTPMNTSLKQSEVYEIWDKTTGTVSWVNVHAPDLLDQRDDYLKLPGFFPCPKPVLGSNTTSDLVPVPDYVIAQDQYDELNQINNRISLLVDACRLAGAYDSSEGTLQQLVQSGGENVLVAVKNWGAFSEKGGLPGSISWMPLGEVQSTLNQLRQAREDIKQQIYEVTGISDILRGASKATETATAQNIKSSFASLKLNAVQNQVALFFSDLLTLKAHLMCKFYSAEKLMALAGQINQFDMPHVGPAIELLKTFDLARLRIKVTTDSLSMPNWQYEQSSRVEFVQNVSNFMREAMAATQQNPDIAPFAMELLKFGVGGFKGARELEGMIDAQITKLEEAQQARAQQPKQPSPAEQLQMQQMQVEQAKLQIEQQRVQIEGQKAGLAVQEAQIDAQMRMQKAQHEMAMERDRLQLEIEQFRFETQRRVADIEIKQQKVDTHRTAAAHASTLEVLDHNLEVAKLELQQQEKQQGAADANLSIDLPEM